MEIGEGIMGSSNNFKKKALNDLERAYRSRGFITVDEIIDCTEVLSLPLDELEHLCDLLISKGFIIRDEVGDDVIENDDEEISDYSQLDYEKIYNRVVILEPSLEPFIDDVRSILPPQLREEAELVSQAKEGNLFAKNRLITMNLRIVVKMALSFFEKYNYPLVDSIQYGNIGLVKALNKMPMEEGIRFSTYAPWWIRQVIFRNINLGDNQLYIPVHLKEKLIDVYEEKRRHYCKECKGTLCRNLTEIISINLQVDFKTAQQYLILTEHSFSLEKLMEKEEDRFSDNGNFEELMIHEVSLKHLNRLIRRILSELKENEREVIFYRFGFKGDEPMTLGQIGDIFGLTRERIRQIEKKAIKRIRHPSRLKYLRCYRASV